MDYGCPTVAPDVLRRPIICNYNFLSKCDFNKFFLLRQAGKSFHLPAGKWKDFPSFIS